MLHCVRKRRLNPLIIPLLVFFATLVGIFLRPRNIPEMWFALAGALILGFAGFIDRDDVIHLVLETGPVLAFLAGMLVVGFVADNAGVFAWLARHGARLSRGNGRRLYVGLYAIGVFVTIWFSLDTTAVVMAPIVYSLVRSLGLPPLPFVFATTYVANTASLLLPVSNLTNLIVLHRFSLPFWKFAAVMTLPAALPIIVNLMFFLWLFRNDIPRYFSLEALGREDNTDENDPLQRRRRGRNIMTLIALLLGLAVAPFVHWELWVVTAIGAAVLAVPEILHRQLRFRQLVTDISWDLLPFVFSLFLVLRVVSQSGLTDWVQTWLIAPGGGETVWSWLKIATTTALGSNLINNLPMLLVAVDSLAAPLAAGEVGISAVYAALIGANLGPNLTVIGSLATMLSLSIIGRRGLRISAVRYLKIGLLTVPLLIASSVCGLWLAWVISGRAF